MTKRCSVPPLSNQQVDVLCKFEGFGRRDAPVWFLGMEEAGDCPRRLHNRATWAPVRDLKKAHLDLGIEKHHEGAKPKLQSTWRPMCALMVMGERPDLYKPPVRKTNAGLSPDELKALRKQREPLVQELRRYQADRLGRSGDQGETFLCELLPIPKQNVETYEFHDVLPMWTCHAEYVNCVLQGRVDLLAGLIAKHGPKVVVAYGKAFWECSRALFPGTEFAVASPEQRGELSTWEHGGPGFNEEMAEILFGRTEAGTLVVLTHHMTRVGDYARLSELAALLKRHRESSVMPQPTARLAASGLILS